MRDSIGLVGIFQIVILFILLFTGIMALTINNSNAFGVKDEIITAVDFNNGQILDTKNKDKIADNVIESMNYNSYRNTGKCEDGWTGYDRDGNITSGDASVCIRCVNVSAGIDNIFKNINGVAMESTQEDSLIGYYYQIQVFYQLDIPVLENAFNFKTKGESKIVYDKKANLPSICK